MCPHCGTRIESAEEKAEREVYFDDLMRELGALQAACDPADKYRGFFLRLVAHLELVLRDKEFDPASRPISEMVLNTIITDGEGSMQ